MNTDWQAFTDRLLEEADAYLEVRGDRLHTRVAHRRALDLLDAEGGDRTIVEPAIILHDVGWSAVNPGDIAAAFGVRAEGKAEAQALNRVHEVQGAVIARRILEALGADPKHVQWIVRIIERHDSSMEAGSLEERLVKDADKLWRYSKPGFWTEVERQAVDPRFFLDRLARRRKAWFLTGSAYRMAGGALARRAGELEER